MDESKPLEEIRNWEHPLWYETTQFEEKAKDIFLESQKGFHLKTQIWMPVKEETIFGPCQETSCTAITLNQESLAERRIIHSLFHWNTLTSPELLGWYARKPHRWLLEYRWIKRFVWFLDRFHSVYSIKWETSRRIYALWRALARNAQLREKHKWSDEKPKLDIARRLRGIYFIDPEDKEFKEPLRLHERNWKHRWFPPCLARQARRTSMERACILEADESTRRRMEESLPKYHEDHNSGKGDNSKQHYNLVHKFILMPQAVKIPAAKAAVVKDREKLEKILTRDITKVRNKSQVIE